MPSILYVCPTLTLTKAPRLLLVIVLTVTSQPLLLMWLTTIFLTSEYRPGSVLECCDILLLILVGKYIGFWQAAKQTRIWLPIKNAIAMPPHAYVITVPHFVYQYLILLLTGYIALTVICNHTLVLCQLKAAWSATAWWRQSWCNGENFMYEPFIQTTV